MPRMYSATGRSRWPILVVGLISGVALGGGLVLALSPRHAPDANDVTTSTLEAPTPSSAAAGTGVGDDEDAAPPTGCLGGLDRNAAMVLTAQKAASHTPYGAVEVATAFYRFIWQGPTPSQNELESVGASLMASDANSAFRDLVRSSAEVPDITGGVVPQGLPFHLSTTNGVWLTDDDSSDGRVTVDIATGYVINGALSPTKVAAIGLTMVWEQDGWHVLAGSEVDQTKLANGAIRFTGGC
jgi:hypothetical protein